LRKSYPSTQKLVSLKKEGLGRGVCFIHKTMGFSSESFLGSLN
jgi:hypothetical protein